MAIREAVAAGGPPSYGGIGNRDEVLRPFRARLAEAWTLRLGRDRVDAALDAAYGPSADLEEAMGRCRLPTAAFFVEVDPVDLRDAAVERGSPAKVRGGSVLYEGIGMLVSPQAASVTVETVTSTRFKGLVLADLCPVVADCAIGSPRGDEPTGPARTPDMKGATGALAEHMWRIAMEPAERTAETRLEARIACRRHPDLVAIGDMLGRDPAARGRITGMIEAQKAEIAHRIRIVLMPVLAAIASGEIPEVPR